MTAQNRKFKRLADHFSDRLIFNVADFPNYHKDASEITAVPDAILFAESETDVIEAINLCHTDNIPIFFRGAGTGYTGGAVPSGGGLVLSLERLDKLELFPDRKMARCGPGVITIDLMKTAEAVGLYYPPDPASYDESTLGGNVAENAGGLHCVKYGVTKDYIIGLKAVTYDGRLLETGIFSEHELFNLTGILIGSEGLLAAITEIAVRLIDIPKSGPTILAAFDTTEDAAQTVAEITAQGLVPAIMEFIDGDAIACSIAYEPVIDIHKADALLLFETDGHNAPDRASHIFDICRRHKATFLEREINPAKTEALWKIRRNLSKAVKASTKDKIAEDVCVPPSKLPELVSFVALLNKELPCRVNSYGHAGDGNLHVNFLVAQNQSIDPTLLKKAITRLFKKTLELGGTLTGEHGIGLTKMEFLELEFSGETLRQMRKVKDLFNPVCLFNPGKMFRAEH
jgi:glycolate oxidase